MSTLVSFILLLVACHATFGDVAPQAENKYKLPEDVKVENYALTMTPQFEKFNFTGKVIISITALKAVDTLTLNAKNLMVEQNQVHVVPQDPKNPAINVTGVKLDDEYEFLIISLAAKLAVNSKYTLTIEFSGTLNDQKKGFYRSRFFDKDNNVKWIAATHFEPTGARWAFPCWDEPAYKAPFTITINHPKNYSVFSNTPVEDKPKMYADSEVVTTTFKKSPAMSTYLVAFVVAEYECVEDKPFRVCTKPHAKEHGNYALKTGKSLLAQLDTYTNYKYSSQMDKMDQVTIRDFSPSAMENWGLVTYRETSLLVQDGVTPTRTKQSIATVIAHEFAHQWFGNLVSPKWWTYVWLNEGFANYMQYLITNEVIPEWRLNETFAVESMQGSAFVADAVQDARPMDKDAHSPSEISTLFDSIGYQKAGSVIRMMAHVLGENKFQEGIRNYLKTNELQAADSDTLLNALKDTANDDLKKDFVARMKTWITQAGYPVVTVKKVKDGEFSVTQERFLIDGSTDSTKWWVPVTYTHQSSLDFTNTTPVEWLNPESPQIVKVDLKDDWILFNKMQTGYYRVNYDEDNWKKLAEYLNSEDYTKISPVNRAQLIDDALNLARAQRLKYEQALSLTTYLKQEADFIPWSAAFRNVNFLHSMLRNSKQYDMFKKYIAFITKKLVKDVGFEAKDGDADVVKVLRATLMKWACKAGVEKCTSYTSEKFNEWLANDTVKLDVDLQNAILCAGVKKADSANWKKAFDKLASSTKDADEKKTLLVAIPVCSDSEEILKQYLNSTLEKDSPVSFDGVVKGIVSEHPSGVSIALDMLRAQFDNIQTLENGNDMITASVQSIASSISNQDEYLKLSVFLSDKQANEKNVQHLQKALQNIKWTRTFEEQVNTWLTSNEKLFTSSASLASFTSLFVVLSIFITRFF